MYILTFLLIVLIFLNGGAVGFGIGILADTSHLPANPLPRLATRNFELAVGDLVVSGFDSLRA